MGKFTLLKTEGKARRARFETVHGTIETPVFMNVGTSAAIKGGISTNDLKEVNCQVELSNTYHLHIRPGDDLIYRMGGGIFRAFTYGSMAIGFILYYFTVGKLTLRLTDIIIGFLKKILKKIAFLLLLPVKKIFLLIFCLYRLTIGKIIGKII